MEPLCSWRVAPKFLVIYSIICFIWQSLRIRIVHQQCHQVWHSPFEVISGCGSAVNGLLGNSTIGCSLCGIFHCWPCVHAHVCYLYVSKQAFGTTTYPIERSSHSLSGHILIIYVKSPCAYVKELEKKIDVIGIYSVSSLSQTVVFNALLLLLA